MIGFIFLALGLGTVSTAPFVGMSAAPTAASERRCGWLDNPTPANWWLTDRHGRWLMGAQGGYQADGLDRMPDMSRIGWIRTNGYYGYGCACLTGRFDRAQRRLVRLTSATPLPLARCRADRALPQDSAE